MKRLIFLVMTILTLALTTACGDSTSGPTPSATILPTPAFGLQSELVTAASKPAAMAFAPDGRLFYAEQFTGDIRVIDTGGQLLPEPFAHLDVANWLDLDWGLTGLALDPNFPSNHFVYAFYTEPVDRDKNRPVAKPKMVRFTELNNRGESPKILDDNFPQTLLNHQGFKTNGSIHFGPDGALFASVGDYDAGTTAGPGGQPYALDLTMPAGKILRLNKEDGNGALGNPFSGDPSTDARVYAYGFRRGANFAFQPQTGQIYSTDAVDSCEELNVVKAGGDYGWPEVGVFPYSDCTFGTQVKAIHFFAREGFSAGAFLSPVNVAGMEFISAAAYPPLGDALLVCESGTGRMRRLVLGGANFDQVTSDDIVLNDCTGDIVTAPNGTAYYSNNKEIRRLVAPKEGAASATQ